MRADVWLAAARSGHLHVLDWLIDIGFTNSGFVVHGAVMAGQIDLLLCAREHGLQNLLVPVLLLVGTLLRLDGFERMGALGIVQQFLKPNKIITWNLCSERESMVALSRRRISIILYSNVRRSVLYSESARSTTNTPAILSLSRLSLSMHGIFAQ